MTTTRTAPVPPMWMHGSISLWLRVVIYARAHADENGRVLLEAGQLRQVVAVGGWPPPAEQISRGIRQGIAAGLLGEASSARQLLLPGARSYE